MDTSPRGSGPAGPQFEAQVGAHYALAVLARTEAFGLPGVVVDRIEFQRRAQGHALDDIVVHGTTPGKEARCLEIQAKRSLSFTESDDKFAAIVSDLVEGRQQDPTRRFAVALERTSGPIENGVQEALELSRHTTDAASFLALLHTPGRGNGDMRRFVEAFRQHLTNNGLAADAELFAVLKSFSVMVFDYARPASIAEQHDRSRAQLLTLAGSQGALYDCLLGHVLRSDAIGGECDRDLLIGALRERGVEVSGAPDLSPARARVAEMGRCALEEIGTTVSDHHLDRFARRRRLEALLIDAESGAGVVELTGPAGAGKSGLLRAVAEGRRCNAPLLVLSPERTPAGGWRALRHELAIDAEREVFLQDLACDGGGLISVDGLDRFRDPGERATVADVVSAALDIPGVTVLFTARPGWKHHAADWLGERLTAALSTEHCLEVEGLDDAEATDLAAAAPRLAPLLRPDHPAKALARNPFVLGRLANTRLETDRVLSEAELAVDWWLTGAHATGQPDGEVHARRRVLRAVALGLLSGEAPVDVSGQEASAVASLTRDHVLVERSLDRVAFRHDLLADWAIGSILAEEPGCFAQLPLASIPPFWLARGFELAVRRLAEGDDSEAWPRLIAELEDGAARDGWTGLALLALVRSEHADRLLQRFENTLLRDAGIRAAALIRRVIATHSQPVAEILAEHLPAGTKLPMDVKVPSVAQWFPLVCWCATRFDRLPKNALAAAMDLFADWLNLTLLGERIVSPVLLERFTDVLVAHLAERERPLPVPGQDVAAPKYAVGHDARETARTRLALHARTAPEAAARYLTAIAGTRVADSEFERLLEFPGHLPSAAPTAFCAALRRVIRDEHDQTLSPLERAFVLGQCGTALFKELLEADQKQGIDLINALALAGDGTREEGDGFTIVLDGRERQAVRVEGYGCSRGQASSHALYKGLQALEYWGHHRIENGESLKTVIGHIADDDTINGAVLLVIVDLVLSHTRLDCPLLADLVASPELLALDAERFDHDFADRMSGGAFRGTLYGNGPRAEAEVEADLAGRRSRSLALHDALTQIVFSQPEAVAVRIRERLAAGVERLGEWNRDAVIRTSPAFMATHALRLASRDNYEFFREPDGEGGERTGWAYRWPEEQWRWLREHRSSAREQHEQFTRALAIRTAMDHEDSDAVVDTADAEALLGETADASPQDTTDPHDPEDPWLNRVGAAAFLARFGAAETVRSQRELLREIFDQASNQSIRKPPNLQYDVKYDPRALAVAGLCCLASRFGWDHYGDAVLDAVVACPASGAAAVSRYSRTVAAIEDRVVRATVRVGIAACLFPRRQGCDEEEGAFEQRRHRLDAEQSERIETEHAWLARGGEEPEWPSPPSARRRAARRTTLGAPIGERSQATHHAQSPEYHFDGRTAAVWLQALSSCGSGASAAIMQAFEANQAWLRETYAPAEAKPANRDPDDRWAQELFASAATHAKGWPAQMRNSLVFDVFDRLSDEAFLDCASTFLIASDRVHLEGAADDLDHLRDVRERVWDRMQRTEHWRRHIASSSEGMEVHLTQLVAALFFHSDGGFGSATCYLVDDAGGRVSFLLPLLTGVTVASAACPRIALYFLRIAEALDPQDAEPFLLEAADRWWSVTRDQRFWNELGIGQRLCEIAQRADLSVSGPQWLEIVDTIVGTGVAAGETLKRTIQRQ